MRITPTIMWKFSLLLLLLIISYNCSDHSVDNRSFNHQGLDSLFQSAVINQEIPGGVALVYHKNKKVYAKAFGYRNIHTKKPIEIDDIFRMASMTKGLTAVAILQLIEQNKLNLDDHLSTYIPSFLKPKILLHLNSDSSFTSTEAATEITIHQLLTHTSGMGYGFQNDNYNAIILKNNISEGFCQDYRTSLENTQKISKIPLLKEPGSAYIYSLSYDVLGTIIEIVSGLRYDEYVYKNILEPLNMTNSYFIVPEKEQQRIPCVYQPTANKLGLQSSVYPDTLYPILQGRQFFSGGADLCSTAEDYLHFLHMIQNDGQYEGTEVLGEKYIKMMLSKQTDLGEGNSFQGYAAWITNEKGAKEGPFSLGSYDFGGFFDTYSYVDPKLELTVIVLLQMYPNNAHNIHEKARSIIYKSIRGHTY